MNKELTLKTRWAYLLFCIGAVLMLFSSFFIFSNLKASNIYEKIRYLVKPHLKSEEIYYYQHVISDISQAIQLTKGNADYYNKKADYLAKAAKNGFSEEFGIGEKDIEGLYMKAIELNPAFFLYHIELGSFYVDQGRLKEAKEELMKAYELYPVEPQVKEQLREYYLILARKYFEEGDDREGFKMLLLARSWEPYYFIVDHIEIGRIIKKASQVSWYGKKKRMIYVTKVQSDYYDFKEQGFPHEKIPLTVRAYLKKQPQRVMLYGKYANPDRFQLIEASPQYIVYEAKVESFPENIYLDNFRIETHPAITIDKIELINDDFR